jgi:hypothetical protein
LFQLFRIPLLRGTAVRRLWQNVILVELNDAQLVSFVVLCADYFVHVLGKLLNQLLLLLSVLQCLSDLPLNLLHLRFEFTHLLRFLVDLVKLFFNNLFQVHLLRLQLLYL